MCENRDFVVPVNILTPFAHAPFSWAARHTTMCLDISCTLCNGRHHSGVCNCQESGSQSADNRVNSSVQPRVGNNSTVHPPVTSGHTPTTTTGFYCVMVTSQCCCKQHRHTFTGQLIQPVE